MLTKKQARILKDQLVELMSEIRQATLAKTHNAAAFHEQLALSKTDSLVSYIDALTEDN